MKHVALLLAGGSGSRMGGAVDDKVLVDLQGEPVFAHVLRAFMASDSQDGYIVVVRDKHQRKAIESIVKKLHPEAPVYYTMGGQERQESVQSGLQMVPSQTDWVSIHDCARPAISPEAIRAVLKAAKALGCSVGLAHRVTDTIRQFENPPTERPEKATLLNREQLWAMETPQVFPRKTLERAHEALRQPVTDDLAAVEALGEPVALVESMKPNPKITRPSDLRVLENLLTPRPMNETQSTNIRVGLGYDIHRLESGRKLVLGGVTLDSDVGLVGHSDADVLSHAIADAILGACGLPDIGYYFPNTDDTIEGISSQKILKRARKEAHKQGFAINNIDATLIAEKPKIAPYIREIKGVLAKTLKIRPADIGIKATTQEQIGALGAGAGIAAHAVATLSGQGQGD